MTIHPTGQSPAHAVLCLNDLHHRRGDEPRVYDLTLARALGYEHARNVRRLIKTAELELKTHGDLVVVNDRSGGTGNLLSGGANRVTPKAGRPGKAYYLNEGQALVVCALARTAVAARVRGELIRVFLLYRNNLLRQNPKAMTEWLTPAERQALRSIIANADVVMAPPAHGLPYQDGMFHYGGMDVVHVDRQDGFIPYMLAPITTGILETLATFESELAELECSGDVEPNLAGDHSGQDFEADDCDKEDNGDDEPDSDTEPNGDEEDDDRCDEMTLGAPEAGDGGNRGWWSNSTDREIDETEDPVFRYHRDAPESVAAVRKASHRIRELAANLPGLASERGKSRPSTSISNIGSFYPVVSL